MVDEIEVPHHSEALATGDMKVTSLEDIEAPVTGVMEVTPPVDIEVTAPTSTELSIHTNEGFP